MPQGSSLCNDHYHFPKPDSKLEEPQQSRKYPYTIVDTVPKLVAALDTALNILSEECSPRSYHTALTSFEPLPGVSTQTPPDSTNEVAAPDSPCDIPSTTPILYVNSEGISLSRWANSILEFYISTDSFKHTYLIDVHVLGHVAFYTPATDNLHTLKTILQSPDIPKVFFDV